MATKLTKAALDKLLASADPGTDRFHYDSTIPGFSCRIRGGRATFVFEYRRHGRVRRVTLGRYGALTVDQARKLAAQNYHAVQSGRDLAEERRAERQRKTTFADAAEIYLKDLEDRAARGAKRGKASTAAEFRRMLTKLITPRIGRVPIAELDVEHLESLHKALVSTPAQANRALTVVSAVLGFSVRRKLRPAGFNPCTAVVQYPENGKRDRLTDDEVRKLGQALREADESGSPTVRAAVLGIRLIALTGMRRTEVFAAPSRARAGEVDGLVWGDVRLEPEIRAIRLRTAKAGAREVPLGDPAVDLLRAARPEGATGETPVCLGRRGAALVGVDKIRRDLFAKAGLERKDLHSLRHTFASKALEVGIPELLVKALLGHAVSSGETARYLHPERDPLHAAATRVSSELSALLGST